MRAAISTTQADGMKAALLSEQIKLLIAQSPTSIAMNFLLVSFVVIIFSDSLPPLFALGWWFMQALLFAVHYGTYIAFRRMSPVKINYARWHRLLLVGAVIGGLSWGLGVTYIIDVTLQETHIFLIILLISLASAGITLAVRLEMYYLFQISVLLPAIIWLLSHQNITNIILGVFLMIYTVAMWLFAYQMHRTLTRSFRLQLENQGLANSLRHSNARLQVLNEELTQLSATDSLTGVANRRYFEERLAYEFSRAMRDHTPLSVMMIDADYFKNYNDSLGHVAGDECLQRLALCVRDSLKRPADLVARYGGEEFVVMLPNTDAQGAHRLAEEIRTHLKEMKMPHPDSPLNGLVTMSFGICGVMPKENTSKETLIKRADEALYMAKAAGRDRVQKLEYI
ncbi:MAG: GGDEF domain-containing protein [Gammaproteobacteria bacterium]|nr:GGDEF domain-containing protein [Gammaproteobacteria bacterium]